MSWLASGAEVAGLAAATEATQPTLTAPAPEDRALREEQLRTARDLVERFPENDDAVYLLGLVHEIQGDLDAAMACWERSLTLDPTRADAHRSLGYAHELREELEEAERHFRQAIALNPREPEYRIRLAHALLLRGDAEQVLEVLAEVPRSTAMGERLLGQAHQQLDHLPEARRHYQAAVSLQPDFPEAYYGLAQVAARLGEAEQAATYRRRFAELKSESQIIGRRQRSEFDAVAIARASTAQTLTDVGRVYLAMRQPEQARSLWERASKLDPKNTASRFHRLMLLQQTGQNAAAAALCRELIALEPENGMHQLGLGNLMLRLGRDAEAEQAFREVARLAPERPEGPFALAQLLMRRPTGRAEAEVMAQRAVDLLPAAPHYYVLSRAQFLNGHTAEARRSIQQACALEPGNGNYRRWRATLIQESAVPSPVP